MAAQHAEQEKLKLSNKYVQPIKNSEKINTPTNSNHLNSNSTINISNKSYGTNQMNNPHSKQ